MPTPHNKHLIAQRLAAYTLIALQGLSPPAWSATALVVDPAAAVRPVLNAGGNGVPIVQIVPPNGAGVSHNKFTHYNVGAEGQILNNSGQASFSQLAGAVGGNPQLGNGHARLILNEVTSAHPSALNGLIEITGRRADLVIANPNGISVDGGGFLNANRATLTTGKPQFGADGGLGGLDIRQGVIGVQGKGLDARGAEQLQLLARGLILNASLHGNDIEAVAGANRIDPSTGAITQQTGSGAAPQVAIDIGRLGGMYAGSIYLIGTEAGVGVNSQGKLHALLGDITLSGNGDLNITEGQVKAAWDIRADAARDLSLQAADIQAGGDLELAAGRHLSVAAKRVDTTHTTAAGNTTTTTATAQHTGTVLEAGGDIGLHAGQATQGGQLGLFGSALRAAGNATLSGADITVESLADSKLVRNVTVSNSRKCKWYGKCTTTTTTSTQQNLDETLKVGDISAAGDISLLALGSRDGDGNALAGDGNLLLLGAAVKSDLGQIALGAARDLEIEASQTRHSNLSDVQSSSKSRWGWGLDLIPLSSASSVAIDAGVSLLAEGSLVTGDSLSLRAGRDLMVRGSVLSADNDIRLASGGDIDILEARDSVSRQMIRESKQKGLFSSGLFGITLGAQSTSQRLDETLDTAAAAQIASINGHVSLQSGRDLRIQGADLLAGGDLDLIGDNVGIYAADNVYDRKETHKTRTSGLTLALKGGALDYIEAAWQATRKATHSDDDRLQAAYAGKAGYNLYQALAADNNLAKLGGQLGDLNKSFDALLDGKNTGTSGVNLELTLGSNGSESASRLHQVTYRAADLASTGDTTVIARAGVAGKGNIDIMGSQLAAHDLTLSAGNQLSARYAPQTSVSQEKSSNTAASVGIGLGSDGLYFTVSGQVGNARGEALKEDNGEARLKAGNKLTLLSGGDTTFKGALANARRIEADIGGDLTLASLQDSERYRYKRSNAGGSLQIGYGKVGGSINAGKLNISNQFQSVVEQSGLYAGDGGFDIQVGKATRLDGAVIASAAAPLNRLSTESLAYSDLTNFEQTRVSGYSFGFGTGAGSNYVMPVAGSDSNRGSVTQAVISPATVEVRSLAGKDRKQLETDSAAQQSKIASLQTGVEKLQAQKAQAAPYQQYKSLLPSWKNLLAYAKANPGERWMWGIPLGALIPQIANAITLAETDPAKLQALIDQDNRQIAGTQANLSTLLGLLGQFQAIDTLTSRDLATANPALKNSFNAARTRNQIEAMNVFAETAMRLVGDQYKPLTDAVASARKGLRDAEGDQDPARIQAAQARLDAANDALSAKEGERLLAHGLVGGLTAALGNVDPVSGFLGGAAGKLATIELGKLIDGSDWAKANPTQANLLKTLAATATGSIVGGATGGMVASQGDRWNRQLHMATYDKLKAACGGKSTTLECRTLQRMTGVNSQMRDDLALPEDKVIAHYDTQGKVVSYTLLDKASNQSWLIMEPLEFQTYQAFGYLARADYRTSSQGALDQASYLLYAGNGKLDRAAEHLAYAWTDPETLRNTALSAAGGGLAGRLAGLAKGGVASSDSLKALARLFDKNIPDNTVVLGGKAYSEIAYQKGGLLAMSNKKGTTKVMDTVSLSDDALKREVFDYAKSLGGGAELKPTSRPGVWAAELADGATINVRSVSSSGASRWTVDVQKSPELANLGYAPDNKYEVKFK